MGINNDENLSYDYISRYIRLRLSDKMGIIWDSGQLCSYTPVGTFPHRDFAQMIPVEQIKAMIDYWYPRTQYEVPLMKKGMAVVFNKKVRRYGTY